MKKSVKGKLNIWDYLKWIIAFMSSVLWAYVSNIDTVNLLFTQLWADPKLLSAVWPLLIYIYDLKLNWPENDK